MRFTRWLRLRWRLLLVAAIAVLGAAAISVTAAIGSPPPPNAIGDPSAFEGGDGNMTVEGASALDWNCLTSLGATGSTGSCGANDGSYMHQQDVAAGTATNVSWPSGTKLDNACPALNLGSNPNKDTFTDVSSYDDTGRAR
jgi:hypothetical protein